MENTENKLHPFEYQKPTEEGVLLLQETRDDYKKLYERLLRLPNCREKSLAITKLEESSMWVNKGIVFNQGM